MKHNSKKQIKTEEEQTLGYRGYIVEKENGGLTIRATAEENPAETLGPRERILWISPYKQTSYSAAKDDAYSYFDATMNPAIYGPDGDEEDA